MVNVRGKNSNVKTDKQTGRKWPKNVGWRRRGRYYITGARHQEFEAAEWSWIQPDLIGLLRQVAYELILADHEHIESLAWPCMKARWHHWRHKHSHVPFFYCPFDRLPVRISTPDLHHRILRKKNRSDQSLRFWSAVFLWLRNVKLWTAMQIMAFSFEGNVTFSFWSVCSDEKVHMLSDMSVGQFNVLRKLSLLKLTSLLELYTQKIAQDFKPTK